MTSTLFLGFVTMMATVVIALNSLVVHARAIGYEARARLERAGPSRADERRDSRRADGPRSVQLDPRRSSQSLMMGTFPFQDFSCPWPWCCRCLQYGPLAAGYARRLQRSFE